MKKQLTLALALTLPLALGLSALAFAPQIWSAKTQPAAYQQTCVTPAGTDEAVSEEPDSSHPKVITRECFPDGSLKLWTKSSDYESRVVEHDRSGKVIRNIAINNNYAVIGWQLVVQTINSRGELIEQNWASPYTNSLKVPTNWTLLQLGVYQGKKDTAHPLAVVLYNGNPTPIIVRKLRPEGKYNLQHYYPDGSMQSSEQVIGDGEKPENRKDYSPWSKVAMPAGTIDASWIVTPNIKDLPDLLPALPPNSVTSIIHVNDQIPNGISLHVGERLYVAGQNVPGAAVITSVVCTDSNGQGTPTLKPFPDFYPNSLMQAVQPGTATCTITYTHNPRDPKATLEGKTVVTITP